ncbi:hypothetical protein [Mesorhizobium sp. WSM2239]|uniref:DUF6894 domain-containing protein n=2 Tax=unclassified Mesorhizobium TaxID=325217 RepID=A0AAU8DEZ1_9HYPH
MERRGQPCVFVFNVEDVYAAVLFFCEHDAGVIPDLEGMDLEDEAAALAQAMVAAGEIMRSNSRAGREALVGAVLLVKDNAGATLFRMPFIAPRK